MCGAGADDRIACADRRDGDLAVAGRHEHRRRGKALVVIADDGDLATVAGEEDGELVLGDVRVLVLVDQDVLEPVSVALQHVRVASEQLDRLGEQVVEVHRAGLEQAGLVLAVDVGVLAVEDVAGAGSSVVGADAARSSRG